MIDINSVLREEGHQLWHKAARSRELEGWVILQTGCKSCNIFTSMFILDFCARVGMLVYAYD